MRTGPGNALDGKPRFDLTKFEPEYFERLRSRVAAAGERGIYVSVMFFEGWALMHGNRRPGAEDRGAWRSQRFIPVNNVNGIDGDLNGNGQGPEIHTFGAPQEILEFQKAYVRQVIDMMNYLHSALYERKRPDWQMRKVTR